MLNIPYVVENKAYSRDWMIRGRIRLNFAAVSDPSVNTSTFIIDTHSSFFRRTQTHAQTRRGDPEAQSPY
jgi:hypothetical protein